MSEPQQPRRVTIDPSSIDDASIALAADLLRAGELVAIPTETVYGLGANALDADAVDRIFAAKGRPSTDPLIVHVDGLDMAGRVIDGPLPAPAVRLAAAFWPGPLTMVLPRHERVPDAVTSGGPTVGVRCPSHPVARAIITAADLPVAAPSANRFGRISPTSADHVAEELGERVAMIVDAGRAEHGLESTVVAVHDEHVVVLRDGAVTREALADHVQVRTVADEAERTAAPGHDVRHYSPRTPTIATLAAPTDAPTGDVVYAGYADRPITLPRGWRFEGLGRRTELASVGHDLYDTLRRLDADAPSLIVVELTAADGIGRAIDDRLTRAASGQVAGDAAMLAEMIANALG
ncbi:MAG: L-threonylcarbamoyladenylate synthase [Actinomycetota bacterium]